jgi:FkbM family methyltransferase
VRIIARVIEYAAACLRMPIAISRNFHHLASIAHQSRHRVLMLPSGRVLCSTVHGNMLFVDPEDLSLSPRLMMHGDWEPETTRPLLALAEPGMNVIEIGANIGWHSVLLAKRIGRSGSLVCFEPHHGNAALLRDNLEINGVLGHCTLRREAVCECNGTAVFQRLRRHRGSGTIIALKDIDLSPLGDLPEAVTVDTIRLDDAIPAGSRVDLVKIDAEGAEASIYDGMSRIIAENHDIRLIIEVSPATLFKQGRGDWLQGLLDSGWSAAVADELGGLRPIPSAPAHATDVFLRRRPW